MLRMRSILIGLTHFHWTKEPEMIFPNPILLDRVTREHQRELRAAAIRRSLPRAASLRRRTGHALIVAGSVVSGEPRVQPAEVRDLPRAA
jgi:hypothetical protein